jgi:hypothetical protein
MAAHPMWMPLVAGAAKGGIEKTAAAPVAAAIPARKSRRSSRNRIGRLLVAGI